jgi:hypothetical protein
MGQVGKPRRIRADRPLLAYDGWHWDGKRVFLNECTDVPEWEESRSDGQQQTDGERYDKRFKESPAAMSLFEIAGYRITKRRKGAISDHIRCKFSRLMMNS